jgi:hypothetical protein
MKLITIILMIFTIAAIIIVVPYIHPQNDIIPDLSNSPIHSYFNSFDMVEGEFAISDSSRNMTFASHYVTFHIHPEKEGVAVGAWALDSLPLDGGNTNNNSDVTMELLETVKYNINIGDKCYYNIYPRGTYYVLECDLK